MERVQKKGLSLWRADVIIVLGGGIHDDGSLYQRAELRVERAVSLYRKGVARHLLFSGKCTFLRKKKTRTTEARAMGTLTRQMGVPRSAIVLEERSQDTVGNIHYCQMIMKRMRWKSAVIVTSDYHVRRARFIAKRITGPRVRFAAAPSDGKVDELVKEALAWAHLLASRVPWKDLEPFLKKRYAQGR